MAVKIINSTVDARDPRIMTSFTFRASVPDAESVAGVPCHTIRGDKITTRTGAALYYRGGGVWQVSGYHYRGADTKFHYEEACRLELPRWMRELAAYTKTINAHMLKMGVFNRNNSNI